MGQSPCGWGRAPVAEGTGAAVAWLAVVTGGWMECGGGWTKELNLGRVETQTRAVENFQLTNRQRRAWHGGRGKKLAAAEKFGDR